MEIQGSICDITCSHLTLAFDGRGGTSQHILPTLPSKTIPFTFLAKTNPQIHKFQAQPKKKQVVPSQPTLQKTGVWMCIAGFFLDPQTLQPTQPTQPKPQKILTFSPRTQVVEARRTCSFEVDVRFSGTGKSFWDFGRM